MIDEIVRDRHPEDHPVAFTELALGQDLGGSWFNASIDPTTQRRRSGRLQPAPVPLGASNLAGKRCSPWPAWATVTPTPVHITSTITLTWTLSRWFVILGAPMHPDTWIMAGEHVPGHAVQPTYKTR